jgi:hypothetical protein
MTKYLVVKGWLGFGDRLESLKMAVQFALTHKLAIYVDWTDSIWSHGKESFYTYFDIVNMPTLKSLDDIPEGATVFPEYWKDHIKDPISQQLLNDSVKSKDLNLGVLKPEHLKADVLVYSSIGNRLLYPDSSFFANVFRVVDPRILSKVRERESIVSNALAVHLRGTDRKKNETQFTMKIQWQSVSAIHNGAFNNRKIVVLSDDKVGVEIWKRFFPQSIVLSELSLQNTSNKGNHNAPKDDLKDSKDEMNVDMLVDFFTLSLAETIQTTYKDSRFAQESRRLHPLVKRILNW